MLEVIDPDIADIRAFTGVSLEIRQLIFVMLLEEERFRPQIEGIILLGRGRRLLGIGLNLTRDVHTVTRGFPCNATAW